MHWLYTGYTLDIPLNMHWIYIEYTLQMPQVTFSTYIYLHVHTCATYITYTYRYLPIRTYTYIYVHILSHTFSLHARPPGVCSFAGGPYTPRGQMPRWVFFVSCRLLGIRTLGIPKWLFSRISALLNSWACDMFNSWAGDCPPAGDGLGVCGGK